MNDQSRRREGRLIAGLIVAGIGTIFLLRNMGYIHIDEWWPLIMIVVGLALARIIHEFPTVAADTGMFTALRSVGLLDVLFKYACGALGRAPCNHTRLHRLATQTRE